MSLLFTAEAGAVRVLARSADPATSEALRANIEVLREAGFEAAGAGAADGKGLERAARPYEGSNESGHEEGGRRNPAEHGDTSGEPEKGNLERWIEALGRHADGLHGLTKGEHEV